MYKFIMAALLILGLAAFTTEKNPVEDPSTIKELTGYRLRSNNFSLNDYNLWVISNEEAFNKTFIAESEPADHPKFDTEMVLAAKVQTINNSYSVKFKNISVKGESMDVYFTVQRTKEILPDSNEAVVTVVPKYTSVKKVNFYHNNRLVRTVPIVNVF